MNEDTSRDNQSSTPFDNSSAMSFGSEGSGIEPEPEPDLPRSQRLPESIRMAGAFLIAHGLCLALNGFLYGRQTNDNGSLLRGLLWFGCTFVLCGALYERKTWAWWFVTLIGGGIGVINLLSSLGAVFSGALLREANSLGVSFIVPVIFLAGLAMLISVALLLTPSAKAAFGMNANRLGNRSQ
jgi:hypothetical protein